MNISFATDKQGKTANNAALLEKLIRKQNAHCSADDIIQTLNELEAAESSDDIPATFRPHPLQGKWKNHFAVNISKTHRLIFRPDHDDDPDFRIDNHKTIKRIVVVELCIDYHKR